MRGDPGVLRIERTFAARATAVFDARVSVPALRRWWPAGADWDTPFAEADVRVGGRLRLVMRDAAGTEYRGEGSYVEITRPRRLVFTWQWDDPQLGASPQLVEVTFTANPDGSTTVVLLNSGLTDREAQEHREGWQLSFDNLDALLADPAAERAGPS